MSDTTTPPHVYGCDVGKDSIVVFDSRTGKVVELANHSSTLADFVTGLPAGSRLVCEATGGWETALLDAALAACVTAHRADARKVKAFIRSLGRLAKTDRIDAQGLARYGQERWDRLTPWTAPDPDLRSLQALVRLRRDLVDQRTGCKQRLKAPGGDTLRKYLLPLVEHLDRDIERIETDIRSLVDQNPSLRLKVAIADDVKGIDIVSAAALIALVPEIGSVSRKAVAALAGTAPHPIQSGKSDRYRPVRGGRPEARRALFMAALCASRYDPQLRTFYRRLLDNGKKKIVAITAVMRKLVTIINARIRDALIAQAEQLS